VKVETELQAIQTKSVAIVLKVAGQMMLENEQPGLQVLFSFTFL
tara:strand:- start:424 stop:555 length:132 start_codon:yes stop_codon:yes gene_type:complete